MGLCDAYSKLSQQGSRYEKLRRLPRKEASDQAERGSRMRMRRLPPDRVAELVERYLAGEEVLALAERFKIHRVSVYNALENAGVPRRKRVISEDEIDEAVRLYGSGLSMGKVGERLGYSGGTVLRVLRRRAVASRDTHGLPR